MRVCGIDLSARDAIVVILDGTRGAWNVVRYDQPKISLIDEDAHRVRNFRDAVNAFVNPHGIQRVAVRKRLRRGRFAGGAVSFKMEALIQLLESREVVLFPPQVIARVAREHPSRYPVQLNEYQREAFHTALTALDYY